MIGTIVVGVDGSETAWRAATVAAEMAATTGARLHVVCAYGKDTAHELRVGGDVWLTSSEQDTHAIADNVTAKLAGTVAQATDAAAQGKPHEVLIAEAVRLDAAMIVVGNRRMQGAVRVLGSVASSVAHHAPCDVHIVKTT